MERSRSFRKRHVHPFHLTQPRHWNRRLADCSQVGQAVACYLKRNVWADGDLVGKLVNWAAVESDEGLRMLTFGLHQVHVTP